MARGALVLTVLVACGGSPPPAKPLVVPPPAPVTQEPGPEAKKAAEAISRAYELLTQESAVPGDPVALREAAIDALAPKGWKARPIAWTNDAGKDVDVLKGAVGTLALRGELPPDAVLRAARAMTMAIGDTQTFALSKPNVQALFAMVAGVAVVEPGIWSHKLDDGRWAVSDVLPGSAAASIGIQRGDILVSVDGSPIVHGWVDLLPWIGVAPGTKLELVVERAGKNQTFVLQLQPVTSPIVESKLLAGGIGYLRVWACTHADVDARDAGKLVAAALTTLDKRKATKLVLDLRGNPGGYPFDVASLFVEDDPLMVAVAGGADQPVARTKIAAWKTKRPIVVIVDEQTASGAEMIAFALKDDAGATIVGRPTAGGLSFPTTEKLSGDVTLSYPLSRVGSAKTKQPLDGNRLVPDVAAQNPSAEDYAAGRDPQLDAALQALKAAR
ncbi:MAG: PDZ domain-containing protein [Deltaproteobacteria bacterium]|nr:PDZ domain-containing protein [Deltaproteobacteria bacterium]